LTVFLLRCPFWIRCSDPS